MAKHTAVYGSVYLERDFCQKCKRNALILDGKFACCDAPARMELAMRTKRMSESPLKRYGPSPRWRRSILLAQGDRCFYCYRWFGKLIYRNGKQQRLRLNWDHVSPHVYSLDNRDQNFVAACHVCNSLKSSKIFDSADAARSYLYEAWERKGFTDSVPEVWIEIHPETTVAKIL